MIGRGDRLALPMAATPLQLSRLKLVPVRQRNTRTYQPASAAKQTILAERRKPRQKGAPPDAVAGTGVRLACVSTRATHPLLRAQRRCMACRQQLGQLEQWCWPAASAGLCCTQRCCRGLLEHCGSARAKLLPLCQLVARASAAPGPRACPAGGFALLCMSMPQGCHLCPEIAAELHHTISCNWQFFL